MRFLASTPPFLIIKNSDIITQIEQNWLYQIPLVAYFGDTYASTSKKYIYIEPISF